MTTLAIGRPPAAKTAGQVAAERRNATAARSALVGRALETAQFFVLSLGFLLVLVAG
jgi:broad specificity phosphatase PhoE